MAAKLTFADLVQDSVRIIQKLEPQASRPYAPPPSVPHDGDTSIELPELCIGIHEWFYGDTPDTKPCDPHSRLPLWAWDRQWWPAALTLMAWMAGRILRRSEHKYLFWIGGAQFLPTIQLLAAILPGHRLIERCIFIDPPNQSDRIWTIDQALRSGAAAAVIANGAGADMAASRRWQLAATAGGVCGLLARPPWEIHAPCLAVTRWQVQPAPTNTGNPHWYVRLLRCKPPMAAMARDHQCIAQWCYDSENGQGEMKLGDRIPTGKNRGLPAGDIQIDP